MAKLTEAQFSMQCSFIAKNAAAWAGDLLTLPENLDRVADPDTVGRFTDEIRYRLDRLDQWAGRTPPPAQTQPVEAQGEPVAWVKPSLLELLKIGGGGAFGAQVSNVRFSGFTTALYAAPQPAVAVGEVERLRDALKNLLGIYDTPLSRRRFPQDDFMKEAIETARAALHGSEKGE